MITVELADALRRAGLPWVPRSGDRFAIPDRDLDSEVFVISEMTIDATPLETGSVVRFNGTTEWALDSIPQDEVIWLPHEAQLRELLGEAFVRLEAVTGGYAVVLDRGGREERHLDIDAERAYARALLALLEA